MSAERGGRRTIAVSAVKLLPKVVLNVHMSIDSGGELSPVVRVD